MKYGSFLLADLKWPKGTRTESFGFLLQALAKRVDAQMKTRLSEIDLDFRFFVTLMRLLAKDGQNQRELGTIQDLPEYQVSRNLDAMAKAGLIERRPSPTSRRTTLVFLTDAGRQKAQHLPEMIQTSNNDFLSALTEEEKEQLVGLMQKVFSGQ